MLEVLCIIAIITNIIAIACSVSALLSIPEQIEKIEINLYARVKAYFDEKRFYEEKKRQLEETLKRNKKRGPK